MGHSRIHKPFYVSGDVFGGTKRHGRLAESTYFPSFLKLGIRSHQNIFSWHQVTPVFKARPLVKDSNKYMLKKYVNDGCRGATRTTKIYVIWVRYTREMVKNYIYCCMQE